MRTRLLLDTNLLVLLIVGTASKDFIATHKRTSGYTLKYFDLLAALIEDASSIVVTPNILSETSNLIRQFGQPRVADVLGVFRRFVALASELYIPSCDAVKRAEFPELGLSDVASLLALDDDVTLLTDDFDLYIASTYAGRKVVNFAHQREARSR